LHIVGAELSSMGIAVRFEKTGTHTVFGYEGEFQQVVLNLISNAKDAIRQVNPLDRYILFCVFEDGGSVFMLIEDSGGGIDESIMDRIFEPYFTTKEQGEGTGIGLYMSKQIIERHTGGSLTVENGKDGARFTVRLPRNMVAAV